jgi:hypothetical protein
MTDIKAVLNDLLNDRDLPLDDAVDRHFVPAYRQAATATAATATDSPRTSRTCARSPAA